jgi:2-amino-4-hydroxy-6-hydroxymethyldihydropteridine diphosphokinase
MCKVYLGLGSNQGDRISYIQQAIQAIEQEIGEVRKASSYYETEPWGFHTNESFINQVIEVSTDLPANKVLNHILLIEKYLGRNRQPNGQQYSNRIIDIDILFYENHQISVENLQVPHPHLHKRGFVLHPLNEIAPDLVHPILQTPVHGLLNNCTDASKVKKLSVKDVFARPNISEINTPY